jgi:hypothetical protein
MQISAGIISTEGDLTKQGKKRSVNIGVILGHFFQGNGARISQGWYQGWEFIHGTPYLLFDLTITWVTRSRDPVSANFPPFICIHMQIEIVREVCIVIHAPNSVLN